jgi:toxin YhaV
LFFRFHKQSKIIIYVWAKHDRCATTQHVEVETWMSTGQSFRDESIATLKRNKTDAYKIFSKMLNEGHPPDDWDLLLAESHDT